MPTFAPPDLIPALPELVLACSAMALLMIGAFRGEGSARLVSWLAVLALLVTLGLAAWIGIDRRVGFYGMFITDPFAVFMKALVLIGSAVTIVMGIRFFEDHRIARFEFPVLVLLATTGMMIMVSANDLLTLYLGIELQSLALYVVASFDRDSTRSSEAGLKYFVLGALASGMLLYGISLVYGFSGTTSFAGLAKALTGTAKPAAGLVIGMVFISVGLAFKVSAVPFHMWTPDVYEGAPSPVTAFFSVAPKMAALALFVRVMVEPFGGLLAEWRQIIVFLSVASMILGAVAAIAQTNIKRLMAYSSIGHVGYALIGLAVGTQSGIRGLLVYMAIYLFMNVGTWAVILCMRRQGQMVENITDLAGLSRSQPGLALALAIFMFAMAGIPPTAGFFSKLYIFLAAIDAHLNGLAVIGVLTSVVGA
ncbi:MAG: NADH-quinone oxidoreductase subunit NuoN, partial [Stellaceae bacterium]